MFVQKCSREEKKIFVRGGGLKTILWGSTSNEIGGSKSCGCDVLVSIGTVLMNNARI